MMNNPSLDRGIRAIPIEATDEFGEKIPFKSCSHCGGVDDLRRIKFLDGYGGVCGFCRRHRFAKPGERCQGCDQCK